MSVEQQELVTYTGNYSSYEKQRAERIRLQGIQYQKQQDKVAHLESFINRFKAKASKAKQAQSRIKQLEKMQMIMPAHQASAFSFNFFPPTALPNPLVKMEQVKVGYGEKVILEKLHLNLVPGSRIGLLGRNGAGKSTLIKLLAEQMAPISGLYETSAGLKIGYFAQHQLEFLDADSTPLHHLQRLDEKETEQKLRDYLGGFGFRGDDALSKVAPMSGGEKARLVLALLVYQKPNLLLLDEPTNHLDIEMRHALNVALQAFEGAMLLVSHDRFLLNSVCDEFYLVDSQQVQNFKGDLDDYKDWLMQSESGLESSSTDSPKPPSGPNRKQEKQQQAAFRQATQALRKRIAEQEKQIQKLEQRLQKIESDMSDPELYTDTQKDKLKKLLTEQTDCKQSLQTTEEQWMMDQESLDEQQQAFEQQMAG
jgi:ATP-binding cassette subfamily F protein 3